MQEKDLSEIEISRSEYVAPDRKLGKCTHLKASWRLAFFYVQKHNPELATKICSFYRIAREV